MPQHTLFDFQTRAVRTGKTRRRTRRLFAVIALVLSSLLVATGAVAYFSYQHFEDGIVRSDFVLPEVADVVQDTSEQNILIMGMDTRKDQNGQPLSEEMYQALHAGNAEDGGYNANVLMLLHIPEDRAQTVGISIPRDDYVEIVGAPLGITHSKIKEAYGLAMQQHLNDLNLAGTELSDEDAYQEARALGRQAQIATVSQFLGNVPIDHFIEISMGGFYHIAEAVAPITVCLNHDTEDVYSGANFSAGVQTLDANQAMSFVRQRRDTGDNGLFLSDLDRSRRQQAFLIALANKLPQQSTLMNPKTVAALVDVTQNHVALDSDFDILSFLRIAHDVAQTGARFVTLPIVEFGMIDGSAVNIVDDYEVQTMVAEILAGSFFADPVETEHRVDTEGDASGDPTAAAEPVSDAPEQSDPGMTSYESWDQPILAGSLPCVN